MFANLRLHLHRLSSRRFIRRERLDPMRIDTTLRFFVRHLPGLLHAECCNIYIYDPVASKAWVEAGTGLDAGALAVPTKNTFVGEVIASGEPRITSDPTSLLSIANERRALRGLVIRNAACVPIRNRAAGAGGIELERQHDGFRQFEAGSISCFAGPDSGTSALDPYSFRQRRSQDGRYTEAHRGGVAFLRSLSLGSAEIE